MMVQPGMKDSYGKPVAPLVGPLRWAVDLCGASVAIDGPLPPPVVTAEDLAEDDSSGTDESDDE